MRRTTDNHTPPARPARSALALAAAATALLAACTTAAEPGPAEPTPSSSADASSAAQRYVDCLRDQGLDAIVTPDGYVAIQADPSSGGDGRITVGDTGPYTRAQQLCQQQVPEYEGGTSVGIGEGDPGAGVDGGLSALPPDVQRALLDFAACARENGFPDYPDPESGAITFPDELTGEQVAALWYDLCPLPDGAGVALALTNPEHIRALDERNPERQPSAGGTLG